MTNHLPGFEAPKAARDGLQHLRDDIHLHAAAAEVRARLADPTTYDEWLSTQIRDFVADTEGMQFTLGLPGRAEPVRLRREPHGDPYLVTYVRDGDSSVESLTWALHVEGATECHVTVELAYRAAGGLAGVLEPLVHRPHRLQALRDSLWRFKHHIQESLSLDARVAEA
ncbi:MAG: SRPBCC family protein [Chloroflexi bacterium]|nr:SRPBCC family protein [Chloroflexota bacterium]MDA1240309.1 SRPBCC family protein [Chloroflexota bacterium]MQC47774.1 SRPBCC family protein [Chloroflexota bacterium]